MPMIIVFLGPPGSGKGTYSTRISAKLDIPHISTGDLFREERRNKTELGSRLAPFMDSGGLVPDELTVSILKERISRPDCRSGLILDGYPRTLAQAEVLEKITKVDVVMNLNLPDKLLIMKLAARRVCKNCGEIYNIADIDETIDGIHYILPPMKPKNDMKCDKCGGELIQRTDDREETVANRLQVYKRQTKPLIDYYTKKGLLKDVFVHAGPEVMVPEIMKILREFG
jgi:adenylate kinase